MLVVPVDLFGGVGDGLLEVVANCGRLSWQRRALKETNSHNEIGERDTK